MARITSQAAVTMIGNRYETVLIAARRARELARGDRPKVTKVTSPAVTALREIEQGFDHQIYQCQRLYGHHIPEDESLCGR